MDELTDEDLLKIFGKSEEIKVDDNAFDLNTLKNALVEKSPGKSENDRALQAIEDNLELGELMRDLAKEEIQAAKQAELSERPKRDFSKIDLSVHDIVTDKDKDDKGVDKEKEDDEGPIM